jgi:hypothetical protein
MLEEATGRTLPMRQIEDDDGRRSLLFSSVRSPALASCQQIGYGRERRTFQLPAGCGIEGQTQGPPKSRPSRLTTARADQHVVTEPNQALGLD